MSFNVIPSAHRKELKKMAETANDHL